MSAYHALQDVLTQYVFAAELQDHVVVFGKDQCATKLQAAFWKLHI